MWKKLLLLAALGTIAAVLPGSPASAQATRTWVSGVGDDANPCSRTAPCKTFAGAISKTAPAARSTCSIQAASARSPSPSRSPSMAAAAKWLGAGGRHQWHQRGGPTNDVVVLRNLRFDGLLGNGTGGSPGLIGISFTSGSQMSVENCAIFGFSTAGIKASVASGATSRILHHRHLRHERRR